MSKDPYCLGDNVLKDIEPILENYPYDTLEDIAKHIADVASLHRRLAQAEENGLTDGYVLGRIYDTIFNNTDYKREWEDLYSSFTDGCVGLNDNGEAFLELVVGNENGEPIKKITIKAVVEEYKEDA